MMNLFRLRARSLTTAFACIAFVGCGGPQREPIIAEPVERPLPPASGTPIGILIDEAGQLALRDEQIDALREIDRSLSTRNEQVDVQLRQMERPKPPSSDSDAAPRGGGRRGGGKGRGMGGPGGGMGGPGMGGPGGGMGGPGGGGMGGPGGGGMGGPRAGGMGGSGAGGRGARGKGPPPGMRRNGADPKIRTRLMEEKTANTREAIQRALDVLDPDQRERAVRMLDERGVEMAPQGDSANGDGSGSSASDEPSQLPAPPPDVPPAPER